MKTFALSIILFSNLIQANAQANHSTTSESYDNAFLNQVYYDQANSLTVLEKTEGRLKSRTKAFGYGGSEGLLVVNKEKSNVEIKNEDTLRFAVKMDLMMADPSMLIKLYRFNSKKGNREAVLSSQPGTFSKAKSADDEISYSIQKSGNGIFIIIPDKKLGPGQYGFLNMMTASGGGMSMSYTVFAFGIE